MVELRVNLPDGFLREEVRCGYTVSGKMKEVWAVELDLLAEFDRDFLLCGRGNDSGSCAAQGIYPLGR